MLDFAYDVYLSFSSDANRWVQHELLPRLRAHQLQIYVGEQDLTPGAVRVIEIEQAIQASRYTLVILSPSYLNDSWRVFENILVTTMTNGFEQRRLIPLRLASVVLPPRLAALVDLNFVDPFNVEEEWQRLLDALDVPLTVQKLAALPKDRVPDVSPLPPSLRMPRRQSTSANDQPEMDVVISTERGGEIEYVGRVLDSKTRTPAHGAKVSLEVQGVPSIVYTDSEGVYRFPVILKTERVAGRIHIDFEGYKSYDRNISLTAATQLEDIRLVPVPAQQIKHKRSWAPWGDHPIVVAILLITAIIGVIANPLQLLNKAPAQVQSPTAASIPATTVNPMTTTTVVSAVMPSLSASNTTWQAVTEEPLHSTSPNSTSESSASSSISVFGGTDDNLIRNGDFSNPTWEDNWSFSVDKPIGASATANVVNGVMCIDISNGGPDLYKISVGQGDIVLGNASYIVSFEAESETPKQIDFRVTTQEQYKDVHREIIDLVVERRTYQYSFVVNEGSQPMVNTLFELRMGGPGTGLVCFDNISIKKK